MDWGFLSPWQYLIHDRDGTYCPTFQRIIEEAGVTRVPILPRSLNLPAYAERWVRSVQVEALSELLLFGAASLRHVLKEDETHSHAARNHQGKGNVLLCPLARQGHTGEGPIQCRERLGGRLKDYDCEAT